MGRSEAQPPDTDVGGPATRRTGLVVPENAAPNPGDRALVWEAATFLQEAGLADEVRLLQLPEEKAIPDADAQPAGCTWTTALLRDHRRGHYGARDGVKESKWSVLAMMLWALRDFLWGEAVLLVAPFPWLARPLLNRGQAATYQAFREASVVAVKGGGFLHAYGGLTAPYYIWRCTFYLRLAHRLRRPALILPNSFGPFVGFAVPRQLRRALNPCCFLSAREELSGAALGQLLGGEVPVYPDMAYHLEPAPRAVGEALCRAAGVPLGEKPCVGLTLRPYRFPGHEAPLAAYTQYLDGMAALVRHLVARGLQPVLVTHTRGPQAHEDDRLAIQALRERLGDTPHSWVDHAGNCREIKAIYGCMDYLVGTRFHSVIFSQGMGVPALALAYSGNKAQGIMADMGLGDYVLPMDQVTGPSLCAAFDRLCDRRDEVVARIEAWKQKLPAARAALTAAVRAAVAAPSRR